MVRPVGMASSASRLSTWDLVVLCTSTVGAAPVTVTDHRDPQLREMCGDYVYNEFIEGLDLIATAGTHFDHDEYLAGRQTGVFFGSALRNFGVRDLLEALIAHAPPPPSHDEGGCALGAAMAIEGRSRPAPPPCVG